MVIDFHKPTGPENRHPEMLKWVWAYFDGYYQQSHRDVKKRKLQNFFAAPPSNQSKTATAKASDAFASLENTPPLYLQHEGHSRTIIGVEKKKNGSVGLLILGIILSLSLCLSLTHTPTTTDPSDSGTRVAGALEKRDLKVLRFSLNALRHSQYQIVAVQPTGGHDHSNLATTIRSLRIP